MKFKEEVYSVTGTGSSLISSNVVPEQGKIIGVVIYHNAPDTDFINVELKDDVGKKLSFNQHIKQYRSRDTEYYKGCKPVNYNAGGRNVTITLTNNTQNFNNFACQVIFIYQPENDQRC